MGNISAISRHKRPQEGPKSGGGSGSGATLRHTYDLIDSKTLQGTKRCSTCRECVFCMGSSVDFENHNIAFFLFDGLGGLFGSFGRSVWGPFGPLGCLGAVWE